MRIAVFVMLLAAHVSALSLSTGYTRACAAKPRCTVPRADAGKFFPAPDNAAAAAETGGPLCDFPGCDDRGRVMGGLGATYLFQWWPIKAYRPCPKCAKNGVKYARSGQSLDEVRGSDTLRCFCSGILYSLLTPPIADCLQEESGGRLLR